jgi:hypothetical protein
LTIGGCSSWWAPHMNDIPNPICHPSSIWVTYGWIDICWITFNDVRLVHNN